MNEQGCSAPDSSESSLILDRLAGLEKTVSRQLVEEVLKATGKLPTHECKLNSRVMIWVVLGMGLFTHLPIRQVFRQTRRFRPDQPTPARSSLCVARQRLGSEPVKKLFERVVQPLATEQTPGGFYKGMRLVATDGTILDAPDCEPLEERFGRADGGRGKGAFPQVRKVSLVELGTHVEFAFAYGGWRDSEQQLVRSLWDKIPEDALFLQDRGFYGYKNWKALHQKHKLLARVKASMIFKKIKQLPDGSYLAKIYSNSRDRQRDRRGILVRVIEFTLNDPQRTGDREVHRLLTNLFDAETYPAHELIELYHERWEEELVYDEQKTHQDPRRAEKPTHLRSKTLDGIRQELYALSLGHFVVRALMFESAERAEIDVDRLSFTGCFRILQCRLPECDGSSPLSVKQWSDSLLSEFLEEKIEERRNRINPRVIKRKMSKWPRARPHHRKLAPLTKTFSQAVVMKT